MLRTSLPDGVRVTVTGTPVPRTGLFVAEGRRILLRQGNRDILLARVDRDHYGLDVVRLPGWTSPVPPVRFADARRLGHDPVRWAHHLLPLLTEFLHDGDWVLTRRELPPYALHGDLVRDHPRFWIDWFLGWHGAVPLRPLSDVDDGRVTAYRKLAAEGGLPPVLLWWQSGFDGFFVVDGHDRLVAAQAAGVEPPVLVLARASDGDWLPAATERHEETVRHLDADVAAGIPGAADAREAVVRHFAAVVAGVPSESARTMAWPLPGGAAEWDRIAATAGFDT